MQPDYPRDRPSEQLDLPLPGTALGDPTDPSTYQTERRGLQRAYIQRLTAENHLRHSVGNETELENLLRQLKDELKELH